MKIITICGSYKFKKEMIEIAKVLGCTYTGTIIIDETGEEL